MTSVLLGQTHAGKWKLIAGPDVGAGDQMLLAKKQLSADSTHAEFAVIERWERNSVWRKRFDKPGKSKSVEPKSAEPAEAKAE